METETIDYFRPKWQQDVVSQLDGVLIYSANEYRIPYNNFAIVQGDMSILIPAKSFLIIKQTLTQIERNIKSSFYLENKEVKPLLVNVQTKITNKIIENPDYITSSDKSIFIKKGEAIGILVLGKIPNLKIFNRVDNMKDLFCKKEYEEEKEEKKEILRELSREISKKNTPPCEEKIIIEPIKNFNYKSNNFYNF